MSVLYCHMFALHLGNGESHQCVDISPKLYSDDLFHIGIEVGSWYVDNNNIPVLP